MKMMRPAGRSGALQSGLMSAVVLMVAVVTLLPVVTESAASSPSNRNSKKPPLFSDEPSGKNRRSADCHFGKKVYELEETWYPDLGSPFGVMYCIRCECLAVQKKRRVAGRTLCRNVKNECPKPNCEEPVLLPGRCCKVCLEDGAGGLGPLKEDVSRLGSDDDDKQAKDFAALLTKKTSSGNGPTVDSGSTSTSAASLADMATGRFTFHKRHLYFSLVVPPPSSSGNSESAILNARPPPRFLQFLSDDGNILEEQELATNDYFNATGKICGVWRKVPRVYKQLLREEKLWVALMEDKDGEAITGRVARYKALSTELLSAVLTPPTAAAAATCTACGGTAAVSMASASNSIHVTVAVSGLVASRGAGVDVETFVVRLETLETASHPSRVIEELVTVQKPQEVNVIEIRTVLEAQEMRLLLRGHIVLSVHAKRAPDVRLRGAIGPRIACDLFDSLVTTADALPAETDAHPSTNAAGLAWMYIGRNGALNYRIKLTGLESKVTRVTIESAATTKPNKRPPRVVEDLTAQMSEDTDVWINGTISRMAGKDLELLYEGELYINVATERWPTSEIRGKWVARLAGESHLATDRGPVLLNPVGNATSLGGHSRAALGWVHVDNECNFHYDVAVTGGGQQSVQQRSNRDLSPSLTVLELVDIPRISIEHHQSGSGSSGMMLMDDSGSSSMANHDGQGVAFMPNIRLLEEFSGYQVENSVPDLNKLSLARMDAGVAYLKLTEAPVIGTGTPGAQFQGWLTNVQVPGSCLPVGHIPSSRLIGAGGDQPSIPAGYAFDRAQDDNNEIPMTTSRCFYEGKLYDDGRAWTAEHDRCMMCSCQRGRVVCDPVVCPALQCGPWSTVIHSPGDCCPMCENVTKAVTEPSKRGCHFDGDQKFHPAGSRWHPYLPPFGFSKCAVCVCDPVTLKVECTKLTCPPLNCPDSEAYRPDPMACCKQCPAALPATTTPAALTSSVLNKESLLLGEEGQARGEGDILSSGGCRFKGDVFENGEEWHPRIQPWGEMRCINCNCKDGKVKCKRKKCVKTRCNGGRPAVTSAAHGGQAGADDCCPSCPEDGPTTPQSSSGASSSGGGGGKVNNGDADAKKKRQRDGTSRSRSVGSNSRTQTSTPHRSPNHHLTP